MKVGYGRVSKADQNPDLQIDALKSEGCERIFTEKASGAQRNRPQLNAALEYLRGGDTLVVWRLDRLARSLKQLIETVEDMEARGIGFKSVTEKLDTTTAGGKLIFHIFGGLAEFERSIIRERVKAGLEAAESKGQGRGPSAFGQRRRHCGGEGDAQRRQLHCRRGGTSDWLLASHALSLLAVSPQRGGSRRAR